MTIEIKPNDTLFFRDSKPFSMSDETWADGLFPPYPSVIYGALRTVYFSMNIDNFRDIRSANNLNNKDEDPTFNLNIEDISLKIKENKYYPVPLDFNYYTNEEETLKIVNCKEKNGFYSNHPLSYTPDLSDIVNAEDEYENIENGLIMKRHLEKYLNKEYKDIYFIRLEDYTNVEPKVGIARSFTTRTSKSEHLYRVGMYRMHEDLTFTVSFANLEIEENGLIKLGGEGKSGQYHSREDTTVNPPDFTDTGKYFKLYLSTPAVFEKNGWLPDWIDTNSNYEGSIPNTKIKVKLICAFTDKSNYISGFDMSKKKPKPILRTVPAGSVYYFEVLDDNPPNWESIVSNLHGKSISSGEYNKQGFGISYIGKLSI